MMWQLKIFKLSLEKKDHKIRYNNEDTLINIALKRWQDIITL